MTKKQKVINYIKNLIKNNDFKPGKRIQSEADLAKELSVSVLTVRNAFTELERDNIIERRQGSGTYIKTHKTYVIILIDSSIFPDKLYIHFNRIVNKVYNFFLSSQWIPVIYNDFNEKCPVDINSVACIINFYQSNCKIIDMANKNNIPIVEFGNELSPYAKVSVDEISRHKMLISFLEENKYENVVVFDYVNEFYNYGSIIDKYYSNYLSEKYDYFCQNILRGREEAYKVLVRGFENIQKSPDAIVITNSEMYQAAKPLFKLYEDKIKDTKIIVYTAKELDFNLKFDFVEIKVDYDKAAFCLFNLALDNINKKWTKLKNVVIRPELIHINNKKIENKQL